jgi:hypothetical protein
MPNQIATRDELLRLTAEEQMQGYGEDRLMHLDASPPRPRRIGLSGAPTTQG